MTQPSQPPKLIFVIGGVMSGIGKGVTSSSIGNALQACGYQVSAIKADPYLNVDAGTMNPTEHGEVFVLDSGLETDQDMGNYERFLNTSLPPENYMTNGMIFKSVIDRERSGGYHGKCVEPTYHITEEIKDRIQRSIAQTRSQITVIEIGGTIGEYQNAIFIEAARQLHLENPHDVCFVMVTYLPLPNTIGELKTKPTQNAVRQLNSYGVHPHVIVARSEQPLDQKRREKIALMCGLQSENIISAPDAANIYHVPHSLVKQQLPNILLETLRLPTATCDNHVWDDFIDSTTATNHEIQVAIVGKYFKSDQGVLMDAYVSVIEALKISGWSLDTQVDINWVDADEINSDTKQLDNYDAVVVPGGFGSRGIKGKLSALQYTREHDIPTLGICYGMQLMCVEAARTIAGLDRAHTTEIDPDTPDPIITILDDQLQKLDSGEFGGSMRLGAQPCSIKSKTIAAGLYKSSSISERHRHRYEFNPKYATVLTDTGFIISGHHPDNNLTEIIELPPETHPFYLGCQFHPEFKARPQDPHPLFNGLIQAAINKSK